MSVHHLLVHSEDGWDVVVSEQQ